MEYAAGARVVVINDKLAETLFPGLDPIGKTIKIFGQPFTVVGLHVEAASLFGGGDQPAPGHAAHHLRQGGRLLEGLDGHRRHAGRGRVAWTTRRTR